MDNLQAEIISTDGENIGNGGPELETNCLTSQRPLSMAHIQTILNLTVGSLWVTHKMKRVPEDRNKDLKETGWTFV